MTDCQIGKYAVIARGSGETWYVGAMNDRHPRPLQLPLDFRSPNQTYLAHGYRDDPSVPTRTGVRIDREAVDATTVLKIELSARGGQGIGIVPAGSR